MVHADQLNAITHHDGLYDGTQLNHPRVAHNMLRYKTNCASFTKRTTPALWVGGQPLEWPVRYALFKQYHILNKDVQVED